MKNPNNFVKGWAHLPSKPWVVVELHLDVSTERYFPIQHDLSVGLPTSQLMDLRGVNRSVSQTYHKWQSWKEKWIYRIKEGTYVYTSEVYSIILLVSHFRILLFSKHFASVLQQLMKIYICTCTDWNVPEIDCFLSPVIALSLNYSYLLTSTTISRTLVQHIYAIIKASLCCNKVSINDS